jgi:hypothetical protein
LNSNAPDLEHARPSLQPINISNEQTPLPSGFLARWRNLNVDDDGDQVQTWPRPS